jgi:hypothetical protein
MKEDGQAATETMLVMMFLMLMIFGAVHLSMFAVTKYMVNYSAFAAARTVMVRTESSLKQEALEAANIVLDGIRWWHDPVLDHARAIERRGVHGRDSIVVTYGVPFGLPIFTTVPKGGIVIRGSSAVAEQPPIPEKGDNADK